MSSPRATSLWIVKWRIRFPARHEWTVKTRRFVSERDAVAQVARIPDWPFEHELLSVHRAPVGEFEDVKDEIVELAELARQEGTDDEYEVPDEG